MQYVTITSDSYEKAVQEAQRKYGDAVRIHSRKDYTVGGGLFRKKRKRCELTCYIASSDSGSGKPTVTGQELREFEAEARTPDPETLSEEERLDTKRPAKSIQDAQKASGILDENGITLSLRDAVLDGFEAGDDLLLSLSDRIVSSVAIDHTRQAHPEHFLVFFGPTGSGKTTTLAKIASLYSTVGRSVGIISLDSYRVGAFEQTKAFADAFGIPALLVSDEDQVISACEEFRDRDLVLVDTMGLSPEDLSLNLKLKGLVRLFGQEERANVLVVPANMRTEDMLRQWKHYSGNICNMDTLIATKLDESESIGSFLTFAHEVSSPVLFCTNGQSVPDDLKKASTLVMMEYLKGFDGGIKSIIGQLT